MRPPRRQTDSKTLTERFAAIRKELDVPTEFSPEVLQLAASRAQLGHGERDDHRELEIIAIDPPGATDIDQAFHLERSGSGYVFWYAIADLDHFIEPQDAIDLAARDRGVTIYSPDTRIPLHPTSISEGAASLLPGVDRPALLWRISLDQSAEIADIDLFRTVVRNRSADTYSESQELLDSGSTDERLRLLQEIGEARQALEVRRGGVSLELPEQRVSHINGEFVLAYEPTRPIENWNAQLSLCCGMSAAKLMVDAGTGILRTLPPAEDETIEELRRRSLALGVDWPDGVDYPTWSRTLDPTVPKHAALMSASASTFRGAGYLPFDGDLNHEHQHSAIAAPYAHVTAPLRRLVDRFSNECALAAVQGRRPESWLIEAFDTLPSAMGSASQKASAVDRRCVDVMECAVLSSHVGSTFSAVVTGQRSDGYVVQLEEPAVITKVDDDRLQLGRRVNLQLESADIYTGIAEFKLA